MRNFSPRVSAVTLAVLFVFACSSEDSPTAPETPTGITRPASLDMVIGTNSSHTLRTVALTLDGREVARKTEPGGAGEITLKADVEVTKGFHTIGLVVVEQASSPNRYFATGSVTMPGRVLDLIDVDDMLTTGQSLQIRVEMW
jgi:hypothetical protein